MGRPRTLDHERICIMYQGGATVTEVSKFIGCGEASVYSILLKNRVQMRGCKRNETFGAKHPLYSKWRGLIRRCTEKNNRKYPSYGGRGIGVCNEWRDNFDAFATWSIANGYQHGLQIDRTDNDGGYNPGNCRWVTPTENNRNRRCVVLTPAKVLAARIAVASGIKTIREVAVFFGVSYFAIYSAVRGTTWADIHPNQTTRR